MKKLKELKELHHVFVDSITELDTKLQISLKKIKQEYQASLTDEKIQLLMTICIDENLDFNNLKTKYLKPKELLQIKNKEIVKEVIIEEEELLDKIKVNGIEYYYEAKEKGIVYNMESKPVGIFKNSKIVFT